MFALLALFMLAPGNARADADAFYKAGNYEEAGRIYLTLLRASPQDAGLLDAMAQTLRQARQFRLAEAYFQRELALNPASRAARRSLAGTLQEDNHPDDARRLLTELTASDPQDRESWYLRGMLSYQTGYYPAAIEELDRFLKLSSSGEAGQDRNRAEVTRAISLVETGQLAEAGKTIPVLLAQPGNAGDLDLLLSYVRLLYESGSYDDAMKQADAAIAVGPGNGSAHFWRALVFQQLARIPQATAEAERARELGPESTAPRALLVRLYRKSGRNADAAREVEWLTVHAPSAALP